jgi:hypothetical protein
VKKICVLLNWSLGCQQCSCGKAWHTRLIGFWKITIVYQLKVVIICSVVCIILQNTARILWPLLRIAGGKRWCRQQFVCVDGDYFKIGYQPGFLELWRRGVIRDVHQQCCVFCFEDIESASHLFASCNKTKEIWDLIFTWLDWKAV